MSDNNVDISDLNKVDVLAALYNASRPQRMGFLEYCPTPMTSDQARQLLDTTACTTTTSLAAS